MAIDSAKKRKSIAAIGLLVVGPVVVPDSSIDAADRQVVAYSYSGIAAGDVADTTATHICIRNAQFKIATATVSLNSATAQRVSIGC